MQDSSRRANGSIIRGEWAALQRTRAFARARGLLMADLAGTRIEASRRCSGQAFLKVSGEIDKLYDRLSMLPKKVETHHDVKMSVFFKDPKAGKAQMPGPPGLPQEPNDFESPDAAALEEIRLQLEAIQGEINGE